MQNNEYNAMQKINVKSNTIQYFTTKMDIRFDIILELI